MALQKKARLSERALAEKIGFAFLDFLKSIGFNPESLQSGGLNQIPGERLIADLQSVAGDFVGEKILKKRKELGMTQIELGERVGLSQAEISKIESGVKPVSGSKAKEIAKALRVTEKWLFEVPKS